MRKTQSARLSWTCHFLALFVMSAMAHDGLAQTESSPIIATDPVAVWPSGPLDVVAAFDKAVDPVVATSFVGQTIPYFEPSGPGNDRAAPPKLGSLRIVGSRLSDAGRTLTLATDPHPRLARYLLPLPANAGHPAKKGRARAK